MPAAVVSRLLWRGQREIGKGRTVAGSTGVAPAVVLHGTLAGGPPAGPLGEPQKLLAAVITVGVSSYPCRVAE